MIKLFSDKTVMSECEFDNIQFYDTKRDDFTLGRTMDMIDKTYLSGFSVLKNSISCSHHTLVDFNI